MSERSYRCICDSPSASLPSQALRASSPKGEAAGVCKNNKNRAAGNVRTCGAVYRLEEIVLVENGFLSQFSKIVPIKIAYLRYAVCGCCLCVKNANCYKSRRDYKDSILHLAQKINPRSKNQGEPALLHKTKHPEVFGLQGVSDWSCYPDSNWRPHPYQGCALPTEL